MEALDDYGYLLCFTAMGRGETFHQGDDTMIGAVNANSFASNVIQQHPSSDGGRLDSPFLREYCRILSGALVFIAQPFERSPRKPVFLEGSSRKGSQGEAASSGTSSHKKRNLQQREQ